MTAFLLASNNVRLWAISDLHVGIAENRRLIEALPSHSEDWLILGGDVAETLEDVRSVLATLAPRFRRLVWVPGNHELWSVPEGSLRGEARYQALVAICRERGVLTPEDPYEIFDNGGRPHMVAPLFTLYDYSFCPDGLTPPLARAWAREAGLECADEHLLHTDPYPTREAWCAARCRLTESRLEAAVSTHALPTVLVNHFPLRADLAFLPRIPRFSIWCGTHRTSHWHKRFRASVVVSGHLHIRQTRELDGVRFEEVSLGYPREWRRRGATATLQRIL